MTAQADQRRVLAAVVLGSSLAFIDGSVVNVALPGIQTSLRGDVADMQWVVNAYMLLLGALVLIGGALGDRLGRRRVFIWGVLLFTAASIGCGLAPAAWALIAARAVQGVGAALLVPASLAIITDAYDERTRGRAIGTWAGAGALTTAIGPVLGGWLVDAVSWRAIFFINVPIALATLWLARAVPDSRDEHAAKSLDWLGATLVAAGLGALTWGLIAVPGGGSALLPVGAILGGIVLLGAFVTAEARQHRPMVPLGVFGSRDFSGANLLTLLLYFALSGVMFFLPYTLIQARGYSAVQAGATLLPFSAVMGLLSRAAGRLVATVGPHVMLTVGPALAGVGLGLLAWLSDRQGYWSSVFPGVVVLAFGMTIAIAPLVSVVMASVPGEQAGLASGINNAVSRVAGLLAVAVLGLVYVGADQVAGFRAVAWLCAACALGSAVCAWTMIGRRSAA